MRRGREGMGRGKGRRGVASCLVNFWLFAWLYCLRRTSTDKIHVWPWVDLATAARAHGVVRRPHSRLFHVVESALCRCTWVTGWAYLLLLIACIVPSVLWRCWLGGRKGIRPVKDWVVGCWRGYLSGARCRLAWPSWCLCHSLSLASVKSRGPIYKISYDLS